MDSPTLLCIDDRPQVWDLRRSALEGSGFRVQIATCGLTAIKILEAKRVAAILLEYRNEGMDAEAVAYQIKSRFPTLPVIMVSAYIQLPERLLKVVDEFVFKSELPEGLVRIALKHSRFSSKAPGSEERVELGKVRAAVA